MLTARDTFGGQYLPPKEDKILADQLAKDNLEANLDRLGEDGWQARDPQRMPTKGQEDLLS